LKRQAIHLMGNLAPMLSGLLTAPMTARSLGPGGRGEVTIIMLISGVVIIAAGFGFGWLARHSVGTDRFSITFWRESALKASLLAIPVSLGVGVTAALVLRFDFSATIATLVLMTLSAMASLRSVDANVLVAIDRPATVGAVNLSGAAITLIVVVAAFLMGTLNVTVAIYSNAAGIVVQVALLTFALRRLLAPQLDRYRDRKLQMKSDPEYRGRRMFDRASRSWASQVIDALVLKTDTAVSLSGGSTRQVGLYSAAALIPQVAYAIVLTIIQRSYAKSPAVSPVDRLRLLQQTCTMLAVVLVIAGAPTAYFFLPWFLGQDFVSARAYIPAACAATLGLAVIAPVIQFTSSGRQSLWPLTAISLSALVMGSALGTISNISLGIFAAGIVLAAGALAYSFALAGRSLLNVSFRGLVAHFKGGLEGD